MTYMQPKKEDIGLREHITRIGLDYDTFISDVPDPEVVNIAALARKYERDPRTIRGLVEMLRKEREK